MAIAPSSRVSSRATFRDSLCSTGIQCSTTKTRCRDGACPVSLRGGRRGKPRLYREFGDERKNSEVQQLRPSPFDCTADTMKDASPVLP
jgi:hypothetical protein